MPLLHRDDSGLYAPSESFPVTLVGGRDTAREKGREHLRTSLSRAPLGPSTGGPDAWSVEHGVTKS
jgi:hypothetical protein